MARIRAHRDGDAAATLAVFLAAVRGTASRDYSPTQVAAWASDEIELAEWAERRRAAETYVAVAPRDDGHGAATTEVVGFTDIDVAGYIDMLFVDPREAGRGIGSALIAHVESLARSRGLGVLCANVSITARPVFERAGFEVVEERHPVLRGVRFTNFSMAKTLGEA
jgi:putative acetyltransferase